MVIFLSMTSSPLERVMVAPSRAESNWMVSLSWASARAWRSEPGPASFVLAIVIVVAWAVVAAIPSRAMMRVQPRMDIDEHEVMFLELVSIISVYSWFVFGPIASCRFRLDRLRYQEWFSCLRRNW